MDAAFAAGLRTPDIGGTDGTNAVARAVREATGVKVNAVGLIDEPERAERVLADGDADAVMLARPWLRNPHWALEAEAVLDDVNAQLSASDLQELNAQSVNEQRRSADIASEWLAAKGLA